jgi:hypothetical protein
MHRTKFYFDELSLAAEIAKVPPSIGQLERMVSTAEFVLNSTAVCTLSCVEDFYSLAINGSDIAQIMFGTHGSGEFRDIFLRIQLIFERSATCVDELGNPTSGFQALLKNENGGWVSLDSPTGKNGWNPAVMQWISSVAEFVPVLRQLYLCCSRPSTTLDLYAQFLFPKLHFHAKASDIAKTGLDYATVLPTYFEHLCYLNDNAASDFNSLTQPHELIASAGANGVEISPESSNTHKDKDAMKAREIAINGESVCCEWHSKLTKTQGRIHFFAWTHPKPEVQAVVGKKVIVGIIADHLK